MLGSASTQPDFSDVERVLRRAYGEPHHFNKRDPLSEVVFILLSTQTREQEYRRTFSVLWSRYRSWERVRCVPPGEIEDLIRFGGFARRKVALLQAVLNEIRADRGRTSLRFLRKLSDEDALDYLLGLPGVGLKTAKCVLMYSLGRDALPVDTHVWRISQRLGWVEGGKHPDDWRSLALESRVPPALRRSLHVTMVAHGRAVCRAAPRCASCVLLFRCPEGGRRLSDPGGSRTIPAMAVAEHAEGYGAAAKAGQPLHRRRRT